MASGQHVVKIRVRKLLISSFSAMTIQAYDSKIKLLVTCFDITKEAACSHRYGVCNADEVGHTFSFLLSVGVLISLVTIRGDNREKTMSGSTNFPVKTKQVLTVSIPLLSSFSWLLFYIKYCLLYNLLGWSRKRICNLYKYPWIKFYFLIF